MDGKGYSQGIHDEQHSLIAQIIKIGDAFDAMTSTRSYRKGMTMKTVLFILYKELGSQFDGGLVTLICEWECSVDLTHIVGYIANGIPVVTCYHCEPAFAILRNTQNGDMVSSMDGGASAYCSKSLENNISPRLY